MSKLLATWSWAGGVAGLLCVTMFPASRLNAEETTPPEFPAEDLEFFEKEVRPLLVQRCYECHSAEKQEGSLRLDSRASALAGGDTGPAIEPGKPVESLLIDAINYGEIYEMPPKSKMPAEEIEILTRWVEKGAPWPKEESQKVAANGNAFDLEARKASHWCWQPVKRPTPPAVKQADWPQSPIDQFILAALEAKGLAPAEAASRPVLIRRLYFDLIGLPPTPDQVAAFVADQSPDAVEKVVDELLAAPQFGERWGRHWLDLMRYAESRGHEFDHDTANAFQYRDYVIRALNADVPYNEFVIEHLAGDLLPQPRLHPEQGFNESILGTGFWFLGDWVHSPTSTRKDESERFDNQIDVLSKSFLGLTVSCARCHDHKFDAISTEDFYALAGYLQSSTYRQARFETLEHNRPLAAQLAQLRDDFEPRLRTAVAGTQRDVVGRYGEYLLAAQEAHRNAPPAGAPAADIVFEDFESGTYDGWTVSGDAFGATPHTLATVAPYQHNISPQGKFFVNSHNVRDGAAGDGPQGKLLSRKFRIERRAIAFLIGGGDHAGQTCVNLLIDGQAVATAVGPQNNTMRPHRWDVTAHVGREAQIEVVDAHSGGWGNLGLDHIVFTDVLDHTAPPQVDAARIAAVAQARRLDPQLLSRLVEHLAHATDDANDPLHVWAKFTKSEQPAATVAQVAQQLRDNQRRLEEQLGDAKVVVDYTRASADAWLPDGFAYGPAPRRAGALRVDVRRDEPLAGVFAVGAAAADPAFTQLKPAAATQREPGATGHWNAAGRMLRTPTFVTEKRYVCFLVRGAGHAFAEVDSHRLVEGPLHAQTVLNWEDKHAGQPHWLAIDLGRYPGTTAHVEFTPGDAGHLEILQVVQSDHAPTIGVGPNPLVSELLASGEPLEPQALAARLQATLARALAEWSAPDNSPEGMEPGAASLADWLVRHQDLFSLGDSPSRKALAELLASYQRERNSILAQMRWESATAMAMLDGSGQDENLFVRGNHLNLGRLVPRRFLEALDGREQPPVTHGSGRLQLAHQVVDPQSPLAARVAVNRLWHHLFGRGIVPTVDNFGVLGQPPSHPELLDYLATEFVAEGWSLKKMIRKLVLTQTYQTSSIGSPEAIAADPNNVLLQHTRIRRLQAEVIRDSILAVCGNLNPAMHGPSVPVYLTEFMQGRGRPGSGPLDGQGRRSIYISVRRNFLSPMMLAFDAPTPFTAIGARNISNVPAQALILMNDPFIVEQTKHWANQLLAEKQLDFEGRLTAAYQRALSRDPNATEIAQARAFLETQGGELNLTPEQALSDARLWADLCHVLLNTKEFIFIP